MKVPAILHESHHRFGRQRYIFTELPLERVRVQHEPLEVSFVLATAHPSATMEVISSKVLPHAVDLAFLVACYALYKSIHMQITLHEGKQHDQDSIPGMDESDVSVATYEVYTEDDSPSSSYKKDPVCLEDIKDVARQICSCEACQRGFHGYSFSRHKQASKTISSPKRTSCPSTLIRRHTSTKIDARDLGLPRTITDFMECMAGYP